MTSVRSTGVPQVTIVVLSYNRPILLEKALQTIAAQTYPNFDVLVIDNRSPSSDRIRDLVSARPGVRFVANDGNLGFTGGMNQGIAQASGEYVYLTEDDIELAPDCVALVIDYLRQHPEAGMAGPVMWNRHTPTIRCAGGQFTLGRTYTMIVTGAGEKDLPDQAPFRTMFLPGAMMASPTAVLRDVGGFHSDFFMYREDVELCARMLERGLDICVVPAARVYHHEPPAAPDPPLLVFHKHKNLAAVYFLHAPWNVLPEYVVRYAMIDGIRRLLGDRSTFSAFLKAWIWVAASTPKLLAERATRRAATRA
jgi:GT2 family glycosyltransferase